MITTWLCSCGSGASPSRTPRAVVCRYSAATTSRACSSTSSPAVAAADGRHRLGRGGPSPRSRPPRARPPSSRRWVSSPSAHTAETDFGALNVRSIPPPRPPPAPSRRSHSPLRGWRPSISAMKSWPSIVSPSIPSRASVSGAASHRPGAWVGSPRGSGSSRRARARRSLTRGSARTRRPWRHRCWLRSSHRLQTTTAPKRPSELHSARTAPAQVSI